MEGVLVTGGCATPPEHCRGTLEQDNKAPNEQWRTLHPPICSWDRPLHSPHDPERDITAKREISSFQINVRAYLAGVIPLT